MVLIGTDEGQLWPVTLDGELLEWGPIVAVIALLQTFF